MNIRQLFQDHIAQTSPSPIGLEMVRASGIYIYDKESKAYIDGIAGFSVANIGHSHPKVVSATQQQVADYMHLIVYGEFIEQPQVAYAQLLTQNLPSSLNCVYFTNSGAEATEGAMKLAKRLTGRTHTIAFNKSYHGSTQGALSLMGDEYWRNAFRPLLPGVQHVDFGSQEALDAIDNQTACVIMEVVQAEAGVIAANQTWLLSLRKKCTDNCTLLIFDEIQSGFGRTGSLWAFKQMGVEPDILLLGKALGGGMPLGAFITDKKLMNALTFNPVLGHITTFGGHPVSCAAGKAALEVLIDENLIEGVQEKSTYFLQLLQHPAILSINHTGLWFALQFDSFKTNQSVIETCIRKGLITDWFLFAPQSMRIAPPLSISKEEIKKMAVIILESIDEVINY